MNAISYKEIFKTEKLFNFSNSQNPILSFFLQRKSTIVNADFIQREIVDVHHEVPRPIEPCQVQLLSFGKGKKTKILVVRDAAGAKLDGKRRNSEKIYGNNGPG